MVWWKVADLFTPQLVLLHLSRASVPHGTETLASIPRACLWSCRSLHLLQSLAAYVGFDQYKTLVKDVPICITTSLQSWRQRKLNPSSPYTVAVTITASATLAVFAVVVHVFHLTVVETVTPELVRLAAGEGDKAVVSQLPFHLQIKGNGCGDDSVELLLAVAQ